jgi:hypothetical protein|tara:strand:+ start:19393 stop:20421 length:1029 start_codon:yes stop_codon:yes gene_type:complete
MMSANAVSFSKGAWIAIEHPKTPEGRTVPLKDFRMWDLAFEAKYGMTKNEIGEDLLPHDPNDIFIVMRPTTRKHGKKRLKVLNPYTGKSRAIFNEQVKSRLSMKLTNTNIDRWILLNKFGECMSPTLKQMIIDNQTPPTPTHKVMTIDKEHPFFNGMDELDLQFHVASYFGAACLMCPQNAYTPLGQKLMSEPENFRNGTDIQNAEVEDMVHTLMQSLGMNGKGGDGYMVLADDVQLVMGVPHFNKNLTKSYTSKPSLGAVIKAKTSNFKYDNRSLYNKQAPDGLKTLSAEDGDYQYFYAPFGSMNHHFEMDFNFDRMGGLFANYPEYGAAHLLEALSIGSL